MFVEYTRHCRVSVREGVVALREARLVGGSPSPRDYRTATVPGRQLVAQSAAWLLRKPGLELGAGDQVRDDPVKRLLIA